ncbi:MAG: hypothetical protein ABI723_16815 [Bacteroidia bacterium]
MRKNINRLTTLLLAFGLLCCIDKATSTNSASCGMLINSYSQYQTDSFEIINVDSILINNKIPFQTTTKNLISNLGNADSIITKTFECGGYFDAENVSIYYYGTSTFETYRDTAVLQKINFREGRYNLKTNKITLSNLITIQKLKQLFPMSTNKSYDWIDAVDKKTYTIIRIKPNQNYDDEWVLKFYNNKLVEIEYWIPC